MKTGAEKSNFLLDYLGVDPSIQRLFTNSLFWDEKERIVFPYKDKNGNITDHEIFSLTFTKFSSCGGSILFCPTEYSFIRNVYISNTCLNLIAFTQLFKGRLNFENAAFLSLSLKPTIYSLFILKEFASAKICLLFGNSTLGRVMDCKISLWLKNQDCKTSLENDNIIIDKLSFPKHSFSSRTFFKRYGGRNPVRTQKPRDTNIDNYQNIIFFKHKSIFI